RFAPTRRLAPGARLAEVPRPDARVVRADGRHTGCCRSALRLDRDARRAVRAHRPDARTGRPGRTRLPGRAARARRATGAVHATPVLARTVAGTLARRSRQQRS